MNKKNNVIIYTSSLCGYCYMAKSLLNKSKIPYYEISIDINYKNKEEMINKSNGRTSVPQIFYKNLHIGGYDDLYKLENENGFEIFNR